jgi:hypothetical protein
MLISDCSRESSETVQQATDKCLIDGGYMTRVELKVLADALELFVQQRDGNDCYPQDEVTVAKKLYRDTCSKLFAVKHSSIVLKG